MADLADLCMRPEHDERPSLEKVRRRLVKAYASLLSGKRPREDEPQARTTPAEEEVAPAPEAKRARGDPEQGAPGHAHCRHAQ